MPTTYTGCRGRKIDRDRVLNAGRGGHKRYAIHQETGFFTIQKRFLLYLGRLVSVSVGSRPVPLYPLLNPTCPSRIWSKERRCSYTLSLAMYFRRCTDPRPMLSGHAALVSGLARKRRATISRFRYRYRVLKRGYLATYLN